MDPSGDLDVNRFFSRTTNKALTEARTTPVILVCIYNKNSALITHDLLYNVFSAYGKILKILIFEKVKVWKAFVEYSSIDEAVEAKRNLNDYQLFNDGTRMNIYFSNLDTVKFQNNNSGGIDYTQADQNDLVEFKGDFSQHDTQQNINIQHEAPTSFQPQHPIDINSYDQFVERTTSTNSQSQPSSGQLKWHEPEAEETDEDFLRALNEQNRNNNAKDSVPYGGSHEMDDYEQEQLIHKFLADAFPAAQSTQKMQYEKPKQQTLKLNSQPFHDPSSVQPSLQQNSLQNPSPFWPQGLSDNNGVAPPGLSFYSNQPTLHEPIHSQGNPNRLMRNYNSFTHIPLRQPMQSSPPLSKGNTFTDLPNLINPGPMNPGMLPRFSTSTDLPKPSAFPKPQMIHFGSVNNLPKPTVPSNFGNMGNMHQGGQLPPPQLNKPLLNPKFLSQPELPMASEISKYKLNELSGQNMADLIERDILLRLMMNKMQSPEGGDLFQQNPNLINDLNDIKKFSPALSGLGNIDYEDLAQLNKGTLDQIYQDLSNLLGKTIENKECAVLYVKGLEHKDIKVQMLYNIFSNFGNIRKIIFIRRQAAALIEYETVEYATKAKDYLNNIVFMGKPLRIYYSFHPIINLKNKKSGKDAAEEIFIGTTKSNRFKKTKIISMNPPSSTLHISNLIKEVCHEDIMRNYFSPYGRIEAIQFKFMDNNRNMCLIRMASMEESLNAMAYLHDTDLGGRPIQISFTKSKI